MSRLIFLLSSLFIFALPVCAQETKYKAVFIYNFTKHFEWPSEAQIGEFCIGILDDNEIYEELSKMCGGKTIGNQIIVVKKWKSVNEISKCQILFIGENQTLNMVPIQSKVANYSTLLISDKEGMAQKGVGVNFVLREGKISFELNKGNIASKKIKTSSYLDNLAIIVN